MILAENAAAGVRAALCAFAVSLFATCLLCTPANATSTEDEANAIIARIDECQTQINDANETIKTAEREYKIAKKAADKAQAQVEEQEARIADIQDSLEQLSVTLYKGQRSDNPILELLDADSFEEFDGMLDSIEIVADEEARLIDEAKEARDELEQAKHSHDAQAKKAQEEKQAAEDARAEAEEQYNQLIEEAAKITRDIADKEARRSLADAVAEKAFPKGSKLTMQDPCPDATVSSQFGYRDFDKSFHQGLDLAAPEGTPYYAAAAGTVIYATNDGKDNGGAGNWVVISHGHGVVSKYMHSKHTFVSVGDIVKKGQFIGSVGQTGAAFGAHLHFQVEVDGTAIDPEKLI